MDKVLTEIQAAEAEAANTVAQAKEDAVKIIDSAKAKCTEIEDSKIKAAHTAAENTVANAKAEADLLYKKIISQYDANCAETEKLAQANLCAAADAIINNLV